MIYNFFNGAKESNFYQIKSWKLRSQIVVTGIDIDDIKKLEGFLRELCFDEECGNLKVVVESLLETVTGRRSQAFYRHIDLHSVTNVVCENISSISKWNIGNQLNENDFHCG